MTVEHARILIQQTIKTLEGLPMYETLSCADEENNAVQKALQDYDEGRNIAENALRAAATALGIRIQEN